MRYFLDTEFIERPGSIQLISIGIVDQNGRTFYAENTSFDERQADDWVQRNVLDKLRWWGENYIPHTTILDDDGSLEMFGSITLIKRILMAFFLDAPPTEFWGYYADYDWVIFCWIFGKMIDLPKGFPMYCKDLKQLLDESGKDKIAAPEGEHNALVDAFWNRDLFNHLNH
ncbi:hypothetical protein LCGC14_2696330 [marine sediment metagenome]|uniref:3'-5' exoribonuclease Rv2179c-like domain-containing protein n=1 Tax=marine sediment metagenome TaxID=412755 RepID=A0A0F8ZGZ2_9ZZZZ